MKYLGLLFIFFCNGLVAQFTITGKVVNESNEALISASVFLTHTQYATVTDEEGRFVIEDVEEGIYLLKASYLGYRTYKHELDIFTDIDVDIELEGVKYNIDEIEISANELEFSSPFSYDDVDREELNIKNMAQDIPFLLEQSPSMVVTSDAGAGIGYTSMRIRGSDATRVNVTVNGVPLNDSESHGVFWVNMPDFSSSVENIQIQRGVGPSTNGAAAFGATLALNTMHISQNPVIRFDGSYGSFNTRKLSFSVNTGLINEQFNIQGRYSLIKSDGFVDRASSDLKSYYFSISKIGERSSFRFNTFSGSEKTYQAWWGVPESKVEGDEEALIEHYNRNIGSIYLNSQDSINLFSSDRRYNYYQYDNQLDDYRQDHYQFIWSQKLSDKANMNLTAHYTRGLGFFEEFKYDDDFADYGIGPFFDSDTIPILSSDLVRRRWLDNHFFGLISNTNFEINESLGLLFGISANVYDGDHYGQVVYSDKVEMDDPAPKYYESNSKKYDYNSYLKLNYSLNSRFSLFADIQARSIKYSSSGVDNDLLAIDVDTSYLFINPKLGLSYALEENKAVYLSISRAQREPVRSDFIDAVGVRVPKSEELWDLEAGYRMSGSNMVLAANLFYMKYNDQLVLTGAVNDVGAAVRTNVDDSYRMGVELDASLKLLDELDWTANLALSQNRISEFTEIIVDYQTGTEVNNQFNNTDIAFSPNIVTGSNFNYRIRDDLGINLLSKFVGKQYLNNASDDSKSLDPYFTSDLVVYYRPELAGVEHMEFKFLVNNILDARYSSNGYTYSYIYGDLIEENFLYPQAGINFLLSASFVF